MFWQHRHWLSISIIVTLSFLIHTSNPVAAFATTPCGSEATVSGRLNFGSKVESNRVLICADWLKIKASGSSSKSRPTKSINNHHPAKSPKTKAIRYSHSASASPTQPRIFASKTQASVGERVALGASTRTHSRNRYLLGIPAEVRFKPAGFDWRFSDGARATSKSLAHAFARSGSQLVRLRVKFAIDFRFAGSNFWRKLSKPIWVSSLPFVIHVGQSPTTSAVPRYVFYDCIQQPAAIGCLG